jgi:NAD(P)-dependent dehydrogenase (short-subunit alcohol dehydrogenase family)
MSDTAERIAEVGGCCECITLDVTKSDQWQNAVDRTMDRFGRIDYLANVAGVVSPDVPDTVVDVTEDAWDFVLDVNLKGSWLGMKATLPSMMAAGRGHIVNVSSLAAARGLHGKAAYSASKGGIEALTRQVAVEYARHGVHVNAIAPGRFRSELSTWREGQTPMPMPLARPGEAHEIGSLMSYLFREGTYLTGQVIAVDGGWSIHTQR